MMHKTRTRSLLCCSALLLAVSVGWSQDRCSAEDSTTPGLTARIAGLLEDRPLVAIGELHGLLEQHCMLRVVIRELVLDGRINAVVVEFGNAAYQGDVDRYLAGQSAPDTAPSGAWRNTTQVFAWHEAMYAGFYRFMRELAEDHAVRLILADPPISWRTIARPEDLNALPGRDAHAAEVIEREILAKGQRALIIFGAGHLRQTGLDHPVNLVDHLGRSRVAVVQPDVGDPATSSMASGADWAWPIGALDRLHADVPDPAVAADSAWMVELQRRANLASAAGQGPPTPPEMARWLRGPWPVRYRDRLR